MGRKLGLLGQLARSAERSARRAASDARRRNQRAESMAARAYERELVRHEKAFEREQVAQGRALERARIANERMLQKQTKEAERQAQLDEWRLEAEEHEERDRALLEIANEGPEVETRDAYFEQLATPRTFEAAPFVMPAPFAPNMAAVRDAELQAMGRAASEVSNFRPILDPFRIPTGGALGVAGLGLAATFGTMSSDSLHAMTPAASVLAGTGVLATLAVLLFRRVAANNQRDALSARLSEQIRQDTARWTSEATGAAERATIEQREEASRRYAAETAAAQAAFEAEESEQQATIRGLRSGDVKTMSAWLAELLPLDLPIEMKCAARVADRAIVELDVDVPEASAIPPNEAKLTAAGKVSYKNKPAARVRGEYSRLICGVGMRLASEVMLNLPTCNVVRLRAWRTRIDPARGNLQRVLALDVDYDYATLAPLSMPEIDPVAALTHFRHKFTPDA